LFFRKIVIHDTSPFLFSTFLNYLYSGQLETKELSVDQLADLMLLSDRYEVDSLKQACEQGLKRHIDEDSVLYFLSMGDQFNAKLLRVSLSNIFIRNMQINI
jgi:BTB/POZ domain.